MREYVPIACSESGRLPFAGPGPGHPKTAAILNQLFFKDLKSYYA
jgi:hypothetical protein